MDRAYSHYQVCVRNGFEKLTFEEAINAEESRLGGEVEKILQDSSYRGWNRRWYSYQAKGLYSEQLAVWFGLFPRKRFCVIKAEDFFQDPGLVLQKITEFLGLPPAK